MQILDQLREKGYRITEARQELLKVLVSYPHTVQEIHNALKKRGINIDLASVYRSLELFVGMGIVHAVDFGEDKKRYEIVDINNHHHHLICSNCKTIEDIALNEKNFLKEIKVKSNFKIDSHNLEFFGLCQKCQ